MAKIQVRNDRKRGCGWRKPGGTYLVCDAPGSICGKLPLPLEYCPTCGGGIKQARTTLQLLRNPKPFLEQKVCDLENELLVNYIGQGKRRLSLPIPKCQTCALSGETPGQVWVLFVGEKFYRGPTEFLKESALMGVSRRITALPKNFKIGEDWVWLVHRKALEIRLPDDESKELTEYQKRLKDQIEQELASDIPPSNVLYIPGVFSVMRPTACEYVVKGTEEESEIEEKIAKGITPVKVRRVGETIAMFDEADQEAIDHEIDKLVQDTALPETARKEIQLRQLAALREKAETDGDADALKRIKRLEKELGKHGKAKE
jgi:hypothetical protein